MEFMGKGGKRPPKRRKLKRVSGKTGDTIRPPIQPIEEEEDGIEEPLPQSVVDAKRAQMRLAGRQAVAVPQGLQLPTVQRNAILPPTQSGKLHPLLRPKESRWKRWLFVSLIALVIVGGIGYYFFGHTTPQGKIQNIGLTPIPSRSFYPVMSQGKVVMRLFHGPCGVKAYESTLKVSVDVGYVGTGWITPSGDLVASNTCDPSYARLDGSISDAVKKQKGKSYLIIGMNTADSGGTTNEQASQYFIDTVRNPMMLNPILNALKNGKYAGVITDFEGAAPIPGMNPHVFTEYSMLLCQEVKQLGKACGVSLIADKPEYAHQQRPVNWFQTEWKEISASPDVSFVMILLQDENYAQPGRVLSYDWLAKTFVAAKKRLAPRTTVVWSLGDYAGVWTAKDTSLTTWTDYQTMPMQNATLIQTSTNYLKLETSLSDPNNVSVVYLDTHDGKIRQMHFLLPSAFADIMEKFKSLVGNTFGPFLVSLWWTSDTEDSAFITSPQAFQNSK